MVAFLSLSLRHEKYKSMSGQHMILKKLCNKHISLFFKALLVFLVLVISSQRSCAQISMYIRPATLQTAVKQISARTKYQFFYNDNMSSMPVNAVKESRASINRILDALFKDKGITYRIVDNIIYLSRKGEESSNVQDTKHPPKYIVSGLVTDNHGNPLPGVSIQIKGSAMGAITDAEGRYTVTSDIPRPHLVYSYVGYETKTGTANRNVVNIVLNEESKLISEVVITALGIKRAQKALSYNVQRLRNEEFTTNKDVNFVNALSGKVAGVTVNASSSGIGGASKVVMRGSKAIEQSNNALYVIDGIPMFNLKDAGETEFSSKGETEAIADINPEDIESLSVLTGGAASALYGSSAANGAIVITTKKGNAQRTEISVTQSTEFLSPFHLPKFQNRYGTGSSINTTTVLDKSWGSLLSASKYKGYSPDKDYFNTGIITNQGISLSTGNKSNQTYASANAISSSGLIPNNKYSRLNFTFRNTTSFLKDKMQLSLGANYIKQNDTNMVNQGVYANALVSAYLFPRGDDWNEIKQYERYDSTRKIYTQYWPQELNEFSGQNPYWINYRNLRQNRRDRYIMSSTLHYQILDWLNVDGRIQVDNANNTYEMKLYATSNSTLTEGSNNGYYGITTTKDKQIYGDFIANINKTFGDNLTLLANVGVSISNVQQDVFANKGPLREDLLPNKFDVFQLNNSTAKRTQSGYHDQTKSLFASVELGYKGSYYLTLTGRNDWPSQLAGTYSKKTSFFYPSIGTSFILSSIFHLPKAVNYLKLRGSFASVGLPFPRFLANSTYEWDESLQQWTTKSNYPLYDLKPEKTNTFEIGLMGILFNHFNFDITLYHTKTYNQTFNPEISVSSAYSTLYVQTGSVRNQGIELALGYKNVFGKLGLSSNIVFSANQNKILELVDNYVHPETGAIINKDRLDVGGLSKAHFILKKGGTLGDLYSLADLQRNTDGTIYVDANQKVYFDNTASELKLGSVFPKSNLSWRNDISWKNFNLNFMFAARFGGIAYSATQAALDSYGVSETSARARDIGYVLVNGKDKVNPESWFTTIGGDSGIPQYYTYSATNIRLQEACLSYTFHKNKLWGIGDLSLTLIGRNLWMLYCKAPFDPELVATTGNYYPGIDNFMTPNTRNIGFAVKLKF